MKKIGIYLALLAGLMIFVGCVGKDSNQVKVDVNNISSGQDLCNIFSKESMEKAIGKSIVRVEPSPVSYVGCTYYTEYREDYNNTPGGKTPGGRSIHIVFEKSGLSAYKADKEKLGNKLEKSSDIKMDNLVIKRPNNSIWQVLLIVDQDKFYRMHFIQDPIDGQTLVKVGADLADALAKG